MPLGEGNVWEKIKSKLTCCQERLVRWQKVQREPMQNSINLLKKRLEALQDSEEDKNDVEMQVARRELQSLLDKEDLQW